MPESVRKSRTLGAFADVCSEILPGFLYVSNIRVARDATKLRALGITHVINCCGELKNYEDESCEPECSKPPGESECQVLKLLLRDDANEDLTPFLPLNEPRRPGLVEVETLDDTSVTPQLFILETLGNEGGDDSWDKLTNYDSEDLTPDSAFLLCLVQSQGRMEGYVWLGESCSYSSEEILKAAQTKAHRVISLQYLTDSDVASFTNDLTIEHQNQESDAFWKLFEAGY
ncbi:hypothetical protein BBJ29_001565 [Phytophthora kernoviae]|uniref:Uncharacterized protein n=1 Tax=Phytophthora kernoviae TaxID=325452 RepID=A0A3F2RVV2_9STRA|nr:hypothetical protein BBJ29_001565 [Phytophthora kernoviae]RLN65256.1 hypothetical protein BBP00_00002950 [Phytophthora kernoviae]